MRSTHRWGVVALLVALLVGAPLAYAARPVSSSDLSSAQLLSLVRDSEDAGWSGYVVTQGTLALPSVKYFDDVASLFGGTTDLRTWWRSSDQWRVDRLTTTGESDLIHDGAQTTQYDYEDAKASVSRDPSIRLPRTGDLLPPVLARRALTGVTAKDARGVTVLASRRVAGISAPGLRVRPVSSLSSVNHVDLWIDPSSGVPLRVEVYAGATGAPAFTSTFRDFSASRPSAALVTYTATPTTEVRYDSVLDIADAANQYAPVKPPAYVASLAATSATDGAVGVYGSGLTQIVTIPLRDREAQALRDQLLRSPDAVQDPHDLLAQEGVLGVLITGDTGHDGVLIAGTVSASTLRWAANDVARGYRYVGGP